MSKRTLRPSRSKLHNYFVSAGAKETALGTAQTVDAALLMNRAVFPSHGAEIVTDEGKVSGKPGVSRTQAVTQDLMLDYAIDQLTFFELGFLLAYTFGPQNKTAILTDPSDDTTDQADDSKYLKFIYTPPLANSIDVTPFTFEHWKNSADGSEDMARFSGGYIDSLSLAMNRGGNRLVNASGQMGFKKYEKWEAHNTTGNMTTEPTFPDIKDGFLKAVNEKPMNGAQGNVWLGQTTLLSSQKANIGGNLINLAAPALTATTNNDISEAAQSATLNFSNNVSRGYRPGGGSEISLARRSDPTRTLDLALEYATQAEVKALNDQVDYAFQWNIFGDAITSDPVIANTKFGFSLVIPRMRIATYDESEDEGIVNADINFTIMDDVAGNADHAIYAVLWLESPDPSSENDYKFAA
ncbi:MAG: hypothetical protein OXI23_09705 [Gemmatimonadota bacterium]|nr:hypothetical protein [Gemmatimonadota bacterium]